jgi:hypothetical protein
MVFLDFQEEVRGTPDCTAFQRKAALRQTKRDGAFQNEEKYSQARPRLDSHAKRFLKISALSFANIRRAKNACNF